MKKLLFCLCMAFAIWGCTKPEEAPSKFDFSGPRDASLIRGFNYTPAGVAEPRHHIDTWVKYDPAVVEFDLDLAKSLNLNQVRVFLPYAVYTEDKDALPGKLRHFIRACHERNIGVMPVVGSGSWSRDTTKRDQAREWVKFLVDSISSEPGLAMWDAMNEPDYPRLTDQRFESAIYMAQLFHEYDKNTPVTIGWATVDGMIKGADYVDVLQFHDYSPTREKIRENINRAKEFAAQANKPFFNGEMGCIARANPYDVTLQEHMDAKVGWYIWELMIVEKGWGTVHGVFYKDGTVRDPSIPSAIMGFFRNRSTNVLSSIPDKEGWITKTSDRANKWLADSQASWEEGLDIAETEANLLEAGELTPMVVPPTQQIATLRAGSEDRAALKELLIKFTKQLEPYKVPQKPRR